MSTVPEREKNTPRTAVDKGSGTTPKPTSALRIVLHVYEGIGGSQISLQSRTGSSCILPRGQVAQEVEVEADLLAIVWAAEVFTTSQEHATARSRKPQSGGGQAAALLLRPVSRSDRLKYGFKLCFQSFSLSTTLIATDVSANGGSANVMFYARSRSCNDPGRRCLSSCPLQNISFVVTSCQTLFRISSPLPPTPLTGV